MRKRRISTEAKARAAAGAGLLLLVALGWLPAAPAAVAGNGSGAASGPHAIAEVADWIAGLQFTDPKHPSLGAVRIHHTPAFIGPGGEAYYRVLPYSASLGLVGLLRAPAPGKLRSARQWIAWYLDHLDLKGTPPGVVYDHWYLADGSGETTCPDPATMPAHQEDASDSYAATLLYCVRAYLEEGGDPAFLLKPGARDRLEAVAGVILSLQQPDGLTWARDDHPVKYTMDNAEVYRGLLAMAFLEREVYGDGDGARIYETAAEAVRAGIAAFLVNPATGLYRVARFQDGTCQEADLTEWYPGTVAILWPHLFGVIDGGSVEAKTQMAAVNGSWNGTVHPAWTTHLVDPGGFTWPSVGRAAWIAGDCTGARLHTVFVKSLKVPAFDWPFTADDGGWLLQNLVALAGRGPSSGLPR